MSNKGGRGLVFFVLLGVVALAGGFVVWRLAGRGGGEAASRGGDEPSGAGGPRFVGGTGTTWFEEERGGEASGAIEGIVLDADGKPVDGARVTLGRARGRNEEMTPGSSLTRFVREGVTEGGGRFKIDGLTPGDYAATAMADGWAPAQSATTAVKERQSARIELRLARGGLALEGRVLDVGGGGVGGARIVAVARISGGPGRAPVAYLARSGPDGQYRLSLVRGPYSLRVEADGYAPMNEQALVARATKKDLRLVPAARLVGRIVERSSRRPIADAEVSVTSSSRMEFKMPREGKSDAEGRFHFTDLEPGTYEIMGRSGALVGAGTTVTIAVAQVLEGIEVELDRGLAVAGRVKDERGAGIGGVRVSASRAEPPFGQASRTRTRPDGTFALEGLIPGRYRLSATAEEGFGSGQAMTKALTKDATGVEIVLPAATKVEGRVTTADGRPAVGARVSAMIEATMPEGGMMSTGDFAVSEADGRFELKRVVPGRLTLNVRHDEHGAQTVGPEEVKAGERRTFPVVLNRGGAISGLVKTADGHPAADVQVRARSRDARMMFGGDVPEVTGPDGRYRITGLPAGRIQVEADRTGRTMSSAPNDPRQQLVTLADGEEKSGVDLVVPAAGQPVRGTVVAADGSPVAGATIVASLERGDRAFRSSRDPVAYSGADGQFTLDELDGGGTHTLRASHPAHPELEVKGIAAGASGVKLQFPADASVAGVVVGEDGKPLPHYTIAILPGPKADEKPEDRRRRQMGSFDARTQRVQAPDGAFEVRRLAAGTHELAISAPAGETATQVVTVQAGQRQAGLRIQVQAGLTIVGRVVEHGSGKPVPGANVSVSGTGNARATAPVNPDGTFTLEGAPRSETIRLSVSADFSRHAPESKELTLKPGETKLDAGTVKLLAGNFRERMMTGDFQDRGRVGIFVDVQTGRATVRSITPDSAAAKAGIKQGDVISAVDGTPTAELGRTALDFLLTDKPGTKVKVVVETPGGGAPRELTLEREAPRPPPAPTAQKK